jgi:hypothetical protein
MEELIKLFYIILVLVFYILGGLVTYFILLDKVENKNIGGLKEVGLCILSILFWWFIMPFSIILDKQD